MNNRNFVVGHAGRLHYIDIMKGITILLVLMFHAGSFFPELSCGSWYNIGKAYRMPVFFFLSGMFFREENNWKSFVSKNVRSLLVPFFLFFLIFSFAVPIVLKSLGYTGQRGYDSIGIKSLFGFLFLDHHMYSNIPIWFLLALFWMKLFFRIILNISAKAGRQKMLSVCVLSFIIGIIGYLLGVYNIYLLLNIEPAMTALPFFCIGYVLYNTTLRGKELNGAKTRLECLFIGAICLTLVFYVHADGSYLMNNFQLNDLFTVYASGFVGIAGIFLVSVAIKSSCMLEKIGRNTMLLMLLQMPVMQAVNVVIKPLDLPDIVSYFMICIATTTIILLVAPIFEKFFPWAIGRQSK